MKNILFWLGCGFALLNTTALYAQPADSLENADIYFTDSSKTKVEKTVIHMKGGKLTISFEPKTTDSTDTVVKVKKIQPRKFWSGIDLGFNGYMTPSGSLTMSPGNEAFDINQGKSIHWGFNLVEKGIKLYKHNVVLVTGLGFDYNNYRFKNNVDVFGGLDSSGSLTQRDYITNRLKTFYVNVPLLLGFDFSKAGEKGLHLAFGVVGGYRIGSYTKQKFNDDNGSLVKMNSRNDFNLSPFRANATVRVGYKGLTLFANYSLTPMFNKGGGPELYPYSFGISL